MVFAFQKTRHPTFWAKLDFRAGIIFLHRNYFLLDFSAHCLYIYSNPCRVFLLRCAMPYGSASLLSYVLCFKALVPKGSRVIGNPVKSETGRGIHNAEPDRKSGIAGKSK